jgi:predicted MFS family arabinose efflux permease
MKIQKEPIQAKPIDQFHEIRQLLQIHSVRLPLITIFAANFLCGPLVTFCPVLIRDVFHSGVGDFGWTMTAFGAGALIGAAVTFIPFRMPFARIRFAGVAAILQGIIIIAIALVHSFPLLAVMLVMAGITQIGTNILINTFLQENAADHNRGRYTSLYQLAMYSGLSIGALLTGFIVSGFGIATAFVINGSLAVIIQAVLLWRQLQQPTAKIALKR